MHRLPVLFAIVVVAACNDPGEAPASRVASPASEARPAIPASSPDLARRADSLERLDPRAEAQAAIRRGDLRFVAVCGYTCKPLGIPVDSASWSPDSLALSPDSLRQIAGTSDNIVNADIGRLNRVAAEYASRYNPLIWQQRIALRRSRPAT